jgi:2-polyprenyl-3-methyl-5-hydroxy-6-metoxy-1,4-benzoquinol methylase
LGYHFQKEGFLTRINPEEFKDWNETMVQKYDPDAFHHHSNPFVRFVERRRVKAIVKLIDIQKEDRVLEIGCGAETSLKEAFRKIIRDISPYSTKAKQTEQLVDLFRMPKFFLQNEVFMQVICSEVLEHLLFHRSAKEMVRI